MEFEGHGKRLSVVGQCAGAKSLGRMSRCGCNPGPAIYRKKFLIELYGSHSLQIDIQTRESLKRDCLTQQLA